MAGFALGTVMHCDTVVKGEGGDHRVNNGCE